MRALGWTATLLISSTLVTPLWSADAVAQDEVAMPRFEIGVDAIYSRLEVGDPGVASWGGALRLGVRLAPGGSLALQLLASHAPKRDTPLTPGITSVEVDLVQSLLSPNMVKRYASVFVSAGFGALATSAEYPVWVTECHQIPNCYPEVTYYEGGLEALLSVGAGAELGIIPRLPLTGRVQLVFTLGDQEPGTYLRFGLGALWRLK